MVDQSWLYPVNLKKVQLVLIYRLCYIVGPGKNDFVTSLDQERTCNLLLLNPVQYRHTTIIYVVKQTAVTTHDTFICRIRLHLFLTIYLILVFYQILLVHQINHVMTKQKRRRYVLVSVESNQRIYFVSCLDGIDTEVAVCTITWLLLAFEAEQNGRTTLKISFVMTWLLCIILPKPLLHAWHLRDAKSVHGGNESIKR